MVHIKKKKSMKLKAGSLKRSRKLVNLYLELSGKKQQTQITNTKNESRDITTNPTNITGIRSGYYEQLYAHKFLEIKTLLKFTQEEIFIFLYLFKKLKLQLDSFSQRKCQGQTKSTKHIRKKQYQFFTNSCRKR